MYLTVKHLLPEHTRITSEEQMNKIHCEGIDIVYFDDWCLSGCNAAGLFEILYGYETRDVRYTFCTYITTQQVFETCADVNNSYKGITMSFYSDREAQLLTGALLQTGRSFPRELIREFQRKYNPESPVDESYLICSDYKIPNQFGSYPNIYEPRCPPLNREFMREVESIYSKL